jgi:hypothetical protein
MKENVTKLYPGWKEAVTKIVERVEKEGYGVMFSTEALFEMMDIKVPETATPEDWKKHSLEVMASTTNLIETLLKDHNLCLHNVRGQGYKILHPDDQVTIGADKRFKSVLHHLGKAMQVLTHVDPDKLSYEGQQQQMRRLGKAAFLVAGIKGKKRITGGEALSE